MKLESSAHYKNNECMWHQTFSVPYHDATNICIILKYKHLIILKLKYLWTNMDSRKTNVLGVSQSQIIVAKHVSSVGIQNCYLKTVQIWSWHWAMFNHI